KSEEFEAEDEASAGSQTTNAATRNSKTGDEVSADKRDSETQIPVANTMVIAGQIVDDKGEALPDATVFALLLNSKGESKTKVAAHCDANGQFRFEAPDSLQNSSDRHAIWAIADGHQLQGAMLGTFLKSPTNIEDVKLYLPKATGFDFKVIKPDGSPLADALVIPGMIETYQAMRIDGQFSLDDGIALLYTPRGDEFMESIGAKTNAQGEANLSRVPSSLYDRVDVISEEFGTQRFFVRQNGQTLRLAPVGEINGRILIDDPASVAGTKLSLFARGYGDTGPDKGLAEVEVDDQGRFHVPAMAADRGTIFVYASGWPKSLDVHPFLPRRSTPRLERAGQVIDLVIDTVPTILVTGKVELEDTQEPVKDAKVTLNCLSSPINGVRTTTDKNGEFSLRVAPGRTLRQVTSMGSDRSLYKEYDYPRVEDIDIPGGVDEFKLPTFKLTRKVQVKGTVRGRLLGEEGQPLGGITVAYHYADRPRLVSKATTDNQGRFTVAIRDWNIIQKDARTASRYKWSILENENRVVDGYRQPDFHPLAVSKSGPNSLELRRE
ncbi:MAG: hypothetical protein AAGG44_10140, partial [Planctomycetota bacterium]